MKTLFPVVILCALCASSSFARIGETEAQIEKRYGKPVKPIKQNEVGKTAGYWANGCAIAVVFIDGKSAAEIIRKDRGRPFSSDEIRLLMDNNGANQGWTELHADKNLTHQEWWRDDAQILLLNFFVTNKLLFASKVYQERMAALGKNDAAEALKGF